MSCEIKWDALSPAEWDDRFGHVPQSNFLQSYEYAQAVCPLQHQKARRGIILIDGREAGLVQITEAGFLFNAFHAVMLDRGPLWFEGFGGAAQIKMFFDVFNRQFPARFGRRRRILPEIEDGSAARGLLVQTGMARHEDIAGYQTVWLDLDQPAENLRAALRGNWSGALKKAESEGLDIEWDFEGRYSAWLLKAYGLDKEKRGYPGADPKVLQNIISFSLPKGGTIIGRAMLEDRCIAAILLLKHGRSATYQVGWSNDEGRNKSAHNLLLWQALDILKQKGVRDLDLGGINDDTAKGVKFFKEGLGGRTVRYVGHYH